MKKRAAFIFALLIVLSALSFTSFASAVEFNVNSNYSQGETMIAKVSGNFISPITKSNVFFYQGHVRIPMEYDVVQIEGDAYIYAVLARNETGNYSISVENIKYMVGAKVVQDNLIRNFSITNNTADFSVNPGAVSSSGDFVIELQNLRDNQIVVDIKTSQINSSLENSTEREILILPSESSETSFSLKSGEKKKISFKPGVGNKELRTIEITTLNTTYYIPIYLSAVIEGTQKSTFVLEPSSLAYSFATDSAVNKTVYLYNTGSSDITGISLSLDDELAPLVNLSVTNIGTLSANSKIPIELIFFSKKEVATLGNIKAKAGEDIAYSSLTVRFTSNYTPVTPNETIQSTSKTCEELSGVFCNSTQECSQEVVHAADNLCCLASCNEVKKSNSGTIIAVIIIIFIIAAGSWFYLAKYKKSRKSSVNLLKIAKGKDKD
jgi:hypothetical protein